MQLDSSENITCFYWSADQPLWFLHHFNLFGMLIVESRDFLMVALPWYPALLSSQRTVLIETGLFICWFNSAVTLAAIVRCFLSTMRFNAHWSLSVSLEAKPELIWLVEFFSRLLEFRHGPWYASSRKTKQCSTALVNEDADIRAQTVRSFSNSVRLRIFT